MTTTTTLVIATCKISLLKDLLNSTSSTQAFYYLRGIKNSFFQQKSGTNMYNKLAQANFDDSNMFSLFYYSYGPRRLQNTIFLSNFYNDKYYGVYEGYFIPTIEGEYRFWFQMDDDGVVFLDLTGNTPLEQDNNKVLELYDSWTSASDINFYMSSNISLTDRNKSKWLLLEKGKAYKFKAVMANTGGPDLFRVGVEIKNEAITEAQISTSGAAKIIQFDVKPKFDRQLFEITFSTERIYFYRDSIKLCEFNYSNTPVEILKCLQKTFVNREIIIAKVPLTTQGQYAFPGANIDLSIYSASYTKQYSFENLINTNNLISILNNSISLNTPIQGITNFSLLIFIDRNISNIANDLNRITFTYFGSQSFNNFLNPSYIKSAQVLATGLNETSDSFTLTITAPNSLKLSHTALIKTNLNKVSDYVVNSPDLKIALNRLLYADFCEYYIIIYDTQVELMITLFKVLSVSIISFEISKLFIFNFNIFFL